MEEYKKEKISVDEFYQKVVRGANAMFQHMCDFPGIDMGNNPMYHMKVRSDLREWIVEEMHYHYDLEV